MVAASRNDPWMSFSRAAQLAKTWQADVIDMGFAGHINVASGFGPWPAGRDLRDELLSRTVPAQGRVTQDRNHLRALP
jgi:predicted alpha/beta hydrolase family esterase